MRRPPSTQAAVQGAPQALRGMLGGAAVLALMGCTEIRAAPGAGGTFYSDPVPVGNGTVRTYLTRSPAGEPLSLGLELTEAALIGLPNEHTSFHIAFPREASGTQYTFVMLDWRPEGHEPEHVYTVPHFDVHFFFEDRDVVAEIPGGEDPIVPEPRFIPADYIAPGNLAEPGMGVHWADGTSGEFHGRPFDRTFIYGYNRGELIFVEPMITRKYLESRPDFPMMVKQPRAYQRRGYYPLRHRIRYDATDQVYRISIDDLKLRGPSS